MAIKNNREYRNFGAFETREAQDGENYKVAGLSLIHI